MTSQVRIIDILCELFHFIDFGIDKYEILSYCS